jgi:hypothetical protein
MSWIQRLITRRASPDLGARMEAETRQWIVRCLTCGHERDLWEVGGVRYRASRGGRSWTVLRCPSCGRLRCNLVYRPSVGTTPPTSRNP